MNFFNNILKGKKYLNIINKDKKLFSKNFILNNPGMLMGDKSFFRVLKLFELLKSQKKVKGDIVEFGIWNGNNLFTIKKIIDFLGQKKNIIGYDNFSGFPNPQSQKKNKKGKYIGRPALISYIKNFFNFKNILIINDDILNLEKYHKNYKKISFIYIDCNIYEPVKKILETLDKKISKGGIIAFDEGLDSNNKGEGKALLEFYKKNKNRYKIVKIKKNYQPDVLLIRK
tara:strand:+ start:4125 stop:4808 length:684 start_codon:yes stop_codon:yes gene_type:complete